MTISTTWDVTFSEADPAGIAYYPRILDACHRAFESFFDQAVKEPYAVTFTVHQIGFPTVALKAEFKAPMRFGDRMRIEVLVTGLSARTVTFTYRFIRTADGIECARIENTTVAMHRSRFVAIPIPDSYRAVFEQHKVCSDDLHP